MLAGGRGQLTCSAFWGAGHDLGVLLPLVGEGSDSIGQSLPSTSPSCFLSLSKTHSLELGSQTLW